MAEQQMRPAPAAGPRPRSLVCETCGAEFGCTLDGPCWCSHEPYRMPPPRPGQDGPKDCLCPACLRARAETMKKRVVCDPDREE